MSSTLVDDVCDAAAGVSWDDTTSGSWDDDEVGGATRFFFDDGCAFGLSLDGERRLEARNDRSSVVCDIGPKTARERDKERERESSDEE